MDTPYVACAAVEIPEQIEDRMNLHMSARATATGRAVKVRWVKIALIILHADPSRGGAERYTVDLAGALARRGHEVSLVASSFAGEIEGVRNVLLEARGWTRTGRYRGLVNSWEAHRTRDSYDVEHAMLPVLHADVYHPHAGMAAEAAGGWTGLFNPRRRAMADVERRLLFGGCSVQVLALSEYSKGQIQRSYSNKLEPERLSTLFNAVDLRRFTRGGSAERKESFRSRYFGNRKGEPIALIIANDFRRKGLRVTIEALGQMAKPPLLLVVGKEPPAPFERMAKALRVPVVFAGMTGDPWEFYNSCDFLVLPTTHDPCSLVVLEALAMGMPVISTVCNGACEVMTDGVHGFVLEDPKDVGALAEAMGKMMEAGARERMARACLELRPRLSYEHHLDRLEEVYRKVNLRRDGGAGDTMGA